MIMQLAVRSDLCTRSKWPATCAGATNNRMIAIFRRAWETPRVNQRLK